MAKGYDFEYILFKSDFRYILAGLIFAFVIFAFGTQFNNITGMIISGDRIDVLLRIDYDGISEIHEMSIEPGTTVFEALKEATYVDYSIYEKGEILDGINDIYNGEAGNWTCRINGEEITGFEGKELSNGDEITFSYE